MRRCSCIAGLWYCCNVLSALASNSLLLILYKMLLFRCRSCIIFTKNHKGKTRHLMMVLFSLFIVLLFNSNIPLSWAWLISTCGYQVAHKDKNYKVGDVKKHTQSCEAAGTTECTQLLFMYTSPVCKVSYVKACNSIQISASHMMITIHSCFIYPLFTISTYRFNCHWLVYGGVVAVSHHLGVTHQ